MAVIQPHAASASVHPATAPAPEVSRVPKLRQDIKLYAGARHRDGSPSWRILDPVRNRFFEIGWLEFELLARWAGHARIDTLIADVEAETPLRPTDAEEWRGRPVQPGERIMVIADPSLVEVTIHVPPEDAIQLELGGEVSVFLNVDPLSPLKAKIVQTSYETITLPDNSLAYVVKAQLMPGFLPRIGLRGTAKVYAEEVSLGYYLMRKPILFLRKSFGL